MTKSDLDTAIDDERRKTGTSFVSNLEKTRYENLALQDISRNVDLSEQDVVADFTFSPNSGATSSINALSSICSNLKSTDAIISIYALSSTATFFNRVHPEDFGHIIGGNYFAQSGGNLWVKYGGDYTDTLRVHYVGNYVAKTSGGTLSAALTASTDEPLGDIDAEAVISFALYKIFKKEGKKDDAKESKERYNEILKGIIQDSRYRRANIYDRIHIEGSLDTDWTNSLR